MPTADIDTAEVTVEIDGHEVVAGTLRIFRLRSQRVGFQYADNYLADSRAYPLDPALPLSAGYFQPPAGKDLFNFLSDAAPDRWGQTLMRRQELDRAKRSGTKAKDLTHADFLLGVKDELRQGAVRLRPQGGAVYYTDSKDGVPRLLSLPRLIAASDAFLEGSDQDLRDLFAAGASLGGARPKAAVRTQEGALALAKFSRKSDEWDIIGFERVQHVLAARSGIRVVQSQLLHAGSRGVLIVERFDRAEGRRIGFMSALTALEASDMDTRSYLEFAEVLARNSNEPSANLEQLFRRIIFSILTSNTDDHMRNHGLVRHGRGWDLSPAYDLNPNPEQTTHLAMAVTLNDTSADVDLACSVADHFQLTQSKAKLIVGEIEEATRGWRQVAQQHAIPRADVELMERAYVTDQRAAATQLASLTKAMPPSSQRKGRRLH